MMRDRLWLGSIIIVSCMALTFLVTLIFARSAGLSTAEPTNRMRYHALPVAISQIYYDFPHNFTANWQIAMAFQGSPTKSANDLIQESIADKPPVSDHIYFWAVDDRGLSDFVNGAFRIFGPSVPSLFYFWFLLLGSSISFSLIAYWRDPFSIAVFSFSTIAVGFCVPIYTRAVCGIPIHISESRMFDVLGGIAFTHLVLAIFRGYRGPLWIHISTLLAQAALLGFLLHARSTLIWLFLVIIIASLVVTTARQFKHARPSDRLASLMPGAIAMVAWVAVLGYQSVMFHPAYKSEIGPRTVWHNVLMGFYVSPVFAQQLQFTGFEDGQADDAQAVEAVLRDMRSRNSTHLSSSWTRDNILNSLGGHSTFDWVTYEREARSLVFRTISANPAAALAMFLWDKPKATLTSLLCATLRIGPRCGWHSGTHLGVPDYPCPRKNTGWFSIFLVAMTAITGLGLAIATSGGNGGRPTIVDLKPLLLVSLFGLSVSLLLAYLFYPAPTQLGGTSFVAATVICSAGGLIIAKAISIWLRARDQQPPSARTVVASP